MTSARTVATFLAFVAPSIAFLAPRARATSQSSLALHVSPFDFDLPTTAVSLPNQFQTSLSLSDEFGFDNVNPVVAGLQSVASLVGGIVLFTLALAVLVSVFIVPAAAKELESNVKTQYPDLWREYQAKLEPGEDFTTRPDLMQELGNKYQKLQMEQFDRAAASTKDEGSKSSSNVIDAETESKSD